MMVSQTLMFRVCEPWLGQMLTCPAAAADERYGDEFVLQLRAQFIDAVKLGLI